MAAPAQATGLRPCWPRTWKMETVRRPDLFPPAAQRSRSVRRAGASHCTPYGGVRLMRGKADVVEAVRSVVARKDLSAAKRMAQEFRAKNGPTPEALAALSWLARGALNAGRVQDAAAFAREVHRLATRQTKQLDLAEELHLVTALGASIEVLAQTKERQGDRAGAVRFLKRQFARFRASPINARIRKNLNLLALEGQLAPKLEAQRWLGSRPPSLAELRGRPVLLFFWAHYCEDSRAEGRVLARIWKQFGPAALALIGATRLYGHLDEHGRRPAGPGQEGQHIGDVFRRHYQALLEMPVIIDERNFITYGASTTPTLVLLDREGLVSLYHPGKMGCQDLARRVK